MIKKEVLENDREFHALRREYKEKSGKNPPPLNFDEYDNFADYKQKLREMIEKIK